MYDIDFTTCKMKDVIDRSITCHPSLYVEKLRAIRNIHLNHALVTLNRDAARIARNMADEAKYIAISIEDGSACADWCIPTNNLNATLIAFQAAAALQGLTRVQMLDIAERT